jgi:hypothetical protein
MAAPSETARLKSHCVDVDLFEARKIRRRQPQQRANTGECKRKSDRAAGQAQQHALHQQLAHQAPPTRSQRRAQRHLARSPRSAGQQQVRDVRARDHQHQAHRAHQQPERHAAALYEKIFERRRGKRLVLVSGWKGLLKTGSNRG